MATESAGEQRFGVSNLEYDLVITLGNLLQGIDVMHRYAQDAEKEGDSECATIFHQLSDQNRDGAIALRKALKRHLANS